MKENPWDELVSPRVGVVTQLIPQQRGADEPVPPYLYTATLAHFDFRAVERQERLNAGKGRTENEAKLSALGEAVERYSAFQWDSQRTYVATQSALKLRCISPDDCVLYSESQYAQPTWHYRRYDPTQETTWIEGHELPSGDRVALPASLVYLVHPLPRFEDYFTAITSNGLAAGPSLEAAILGGLYELIERDALMITWMNRLPAIELELPDLGFCGASVVRHYQKFGMQLRAFLIRTDQLPTVVMAVAFETDPARPARVIGMGCDLQPSVAVDKAIFELCQARPSEAMRFRDKPPAGRLKNYQDVVKLEDHPAFFGLPENSYEFDFLSSTQEKVSLGSVPDYSTDQASSNLDLCVDRLISTGHRVAYAELTTPDVASVGFRVVRAIASGLQPIHFGWGEARLGGRRLFEAPMLWGFRDKPTRVEDLNLCPHPLA